MDRDLFNSAVSKKRKTYVSDHYEPKSNLRTFNKLQIHSNQSIDCHHERSGENRCPKSQKVARNFILDESESENDTHNDSAYEFRTENGSGGSEIDTPTPFSYESQ